ncbi:MAG: hypothetical protein V3U92_09815 [Cellulophaga sp.]
MIKKIFFFNIFLFSVLVSGQVAQHNQFPSVLPKHILDDKLENISFALSMRVVESDYNGSLIRLRRNNDNQEKDFGWGDNDIVDVNAINTWKGTASVYVVIWYDQSGLGRNAVQPMASRQPRFFPDATHPYFQGNGSTHRLDINTSIQVLTNLGANGTLLGIITATTKSQHCFGVLSGRNRWSAHINWVNNNTYFDPGNCCNNPRYFNNTSSVNKWNQYTFIRTSTTVAARRKATLMFSGNHTTGRCTLNNNFGILYANGTGSSHHSTIKISELIMYKTDISDTIYKEIEGNEITFWNL